MKKRPTCHTRPVRNIALGGLTVVSAFAVSAFAAGAAFASTPGSTKLVPSVGTVPSGLTSLDHGGLPVTAALPGFAGSGLAGMASGLGLLSALPMAGHLVPAAAHQSAVVSKPAKHLRNGKGKGKGQGRTKVGSNRSVPPVKGGVSGPSGALPNVSGITGLVRGIPVTGLLGSVK